MLAVRGSTGQDQGQMARLLSVLFLLEILFFCLDKRSVAIARNLENFRAPVDDCLKTGAIAHLIFCVNKSVCTKVFYIKD